jgi:hypothetical protein
MYCFLYKSTIQRIYTVIMGHILSKTEQSSVQRNVQSSEQRTNEYLINRKRENDSNAIDWNELSKKIDTDVCKKVDELMIAVKSDNRIYHMPVARQLSKLLIQDPEERSLDYFQRMFNDFEFILDNGVSDLRKSSILFTCQMYNGRVNLVLSSRTMDK